MNCCIVGGTGTLGHAIVRALIDSSFKQNEITIFSRDELKQHNMKKLFPNLNYKLGDIRDKTRLHQCLNNMDYVFHAAALKQVDTLEYNVSEAIKTNIIGGMNVADVCRDRVRACIFSSTDKAVLPINTYGYSKGIIEHYFHSLNTESTYTKYIVCRWGNIIGSRGSVVPIFINQIKNNLPVTITDKRMTRFWMNIKDAAEFMIGSILCEPLGTRIPKMRAAKVQLVASVIAEILGKNVTFKYIGIRPGEKIHECLWTSHDKCINSNNKNIQYSRKELTNLLKPLVEKHI